MDRMTMLLLTAYVFLIYNIKNSELIRMEQYFIPVTCGSKVESDNNNYSCIFMEKFNDIESVDNAKHYMKDSIFFVEGSCAGGLNFRQACSIESAARANPKKNIIVLFAGPVNSFCRSLSPLWDLLNYYKNVHIFRVHIYTYIKGTPLESTLNFDSYSNEDMTDIIKLVTFYKYGGTFLETDVIVVKSFDSLSNKSWIGRDDTQGFGSSVVTLLNRGVGRNILKPLLYMLSKGPFANYGMIDAIMKILPKFCHNNVNFPERFDEIITKCKGFKVYPQSYFYPIKQIDWKKYFSPFNAPISEGPYAYTVWRRDSINEVIYDDSLYAQLMKAYCPAVHCLLK